MVTPRFDLVGTWLEATYGAAPTPAAAQARRLGAALRLVIDRLVSTAAPAEALAAAADQVEVLATRLAAHDHGGLYRGVAEQHDPAAGYPTAFFEFAPLLGRANPLAPPLTVEVVDGQLIGRATFGEAYEGPPGCVHGGFIAACFDDVLGMVQAASEDLGMTGTLTVRYLAPTPLHQELRFIGTLAGIDGRKVRTRGELWAGDLRTAEAEAVFITVGAEHFRALRQQQRGGC